MARIRPSLSIDDLAVAGAFRHAKRSAWLFQWAGDVVGPRKIACLLDFGSAGVPRSMLIKYRLPGSGELRFYAVGLHAVSFVRRGQSSNWRFRCPATIDGAPCLQETRELVLLSAAQPLFACRECGHRFANGRRTLWPRGTRCAAAARRMHVTLSSPSLPAIQCPACYRQIAPDNFCSACGTTLTHRAVRKRTNPYEILELAKQALSRKSLKTAYRQKVMEYHPDRVAHAGRKIRELAHEETVRINDAYRTILSTLG